MRTTDPCTPHDPRASSARRLTTTALLAALLAASVLVTIPLGAVPLTLQVFVVVLIALLVPPAWAALSVGTYLLVGGVGLPVFSGMRGGLAVLLGPTGGYLIGFLLGAVAGAWMRRALAVFVPSRILRDSVAALVTVVVIYLVGWLQLAGVAHMGALAALLAGVAPFVAPDLIKAAAAVALAPAVRRAARL